jgi:hypothetical protein
MGDRQPRQWSRRRLLDQQTQRLHLRLDPQQSRPIEAMKFYAYRHTAPPHIRVTRFRLAGHTLGVSCTIGRWHFTLQIRDVPDAEVIAYYTRPQ